MLRALLQFLWNQDIVRQQFKRKSVTFKSNSLGVLLKREEVDGQSKNEGSVAGLDQDIYRSQTSNDSSSKAWH